MQLFPQVKPPSITNKKIRFSLDSSHEEEGEEIEQLPILVGKVEFDWEERINKPSNQSDDRSI